MQPTSFVAAASWECPPTLSTRLSADPFNLSSIEDVFRVKGRAENKALPILVNSIEQAVTLARDLPDSFLVLAHKFWPGALTLVVEATHGCHSK